MTDCAKVAPPPRTTEGELLLLHCADGASSLRFISEKRIMRGIRRFDCCNCLMSFLLGDLNDNESPKSIWARGRRKKLRTTV